jgi:hypothetical protein
MHELQMGPLGVGRPVRQLPHVQGPASNPLLSCLPQPQIYNHCAACTYVQEDSFSPSSTKASWLFIKSLFRIIHEEKSICTTHPLCIHIRMTGWIIPVPCCLPGSAWLYSVGEGHPGDPVTARCPGSDGQLSYGNFHGGLPNAANFHFYFDRRSRSCHMYVPPVSTSNSMKSHAVAFDASLEMEYAARTLSGCQASDQP